MSIVYFQISIFEKAKENQYTPDNTRNKTTQNTSLVLNEFCFLAVDKEKEGIIILGLRL
jgi:hypothetical protein